MEPVHAIAQYNRQCCRQRLIFSSIVCSRFFKNFNPNHPFEKWACREVKDFENIPDGMSTIEIPEGLYAVFHYKGDNSQAVEMYNYIFTDWLPNSEYQLDLRPHFEILGEAYKYNDPASEEDIYIPIKLK